MTSTSDNFSVFVPLLKVNEDQRLVYGVMAEEVLDNSGEIFDYETSKPHFEKWSEDAYSTSDGKSKGNLRVMHGSVAAGKLTDISYDDGAKRIECCAKVVDDNEWKKVLEGVYTGFSIGGRYEKRWTSKSDDGSQGTRYTAKPVEVSLVDKPCIPTATFQMIKSDGVVEDRHFSSVLDEEVEKGAGKQPRDKDGQFASTGSGGASSAPKKHYVQVFSGSKHLGDHHIDASDEKSAARQVASKYRGQKIKVFVGSSTTPVINRKSFEIEDLAKHDGEDEMNLEYTPTNDELLPVAREFAKAANGDDADWVNFMDAARDDLIAKAADKKKGESEKPLTGEEREEALEGDAGSDEKSSDASEKDEEEAEKVDGEVDEETPAKTSKKQKEEEEEDTSAAKADQGDDFNPGMTQVWQTTDGKTFFAKKEAVDHQKSLDSDPSLADLIKSAKDKIAEGKAEKVEEDEGDYGDVEYADPGYQEGGKPRYPIDTEQHIRAAWNYIHQEKNAAEYEAKQVTRIKNRIIAAWKDVIDEAGPPSVEKMTAFGDLEKVHAFVTSDDYVAKGMWEVSRMADVLSSVASIQSSLQYEAKYEGDNSPIPAKLRDAVASLGTIMVEMVSEEVGELLERLAEKEEGPEATYASPIMALAASSFGLEKADSDDLAKSMIAGKAMYRIQKMHDHCISLGAKCAKVDEQPEGKVSEDAVITEKMAKFDTVAEENELLKADLNGAKSEIAEAKEMIKTLVADIDRIKALPMPSAPRTHVVDKTGDVEKGDAIAPDLSKMSKEQLADLAIRMAQSQGNAMLKR